MAPLSVTLTPAVTVMRIRLEQKGEMNLCPEK